MKADENGKVRLAEKFRDLMADQYHHAQESLLLDLKNDYPALRAMVLGDKEGTTVILPSDLVLSRRPLEAAVSIRRRQFGVTATWEGSNFHDILKIIEGDLQHDRGPWRLDWREEQKLQQKWSCT